MVKIALIVGSTRPGTKAPAVTQWMYGLAKKHGGAEFEVVDIADFHLPLLDEPIPPAAGQYSQPHTKAWAAKIAEYDGFIFVTPEYDHGVPGALKNAIDFLYGEWNNKAAGFVSYGSMGGVRAVEQFRAIMAHLAIADVQQQVAFSLFTDFEDFSKFKPDPRHEEEATVLFDQVIAWAQALKPLRANQ